MLLDSLLLANNAGLEEEISQGIIRKIAQGMPELTDHSPGSPHVVMAEGLAWGSSLLLYYVAQQPQLFEEWMLRHLYHTVARPATNAQASLQLAFSTPAPTGGRTVTAGTRFKGGGSDWTVLESFTFPEGSYGNETHLTEVGLVWNFLIPVACNSSGARYNTAANTISTVTQLTSGLVSVTNPAAAYGGKDEESYADMRQRYFNSRIEEDLLVTHIDFEAATSRFLGPNSRVYVVTPPPTPGFVHISALYPDGTPLVAHNELQIHLNSRSPMAPVRYVPPAVIGVAVNVTLKYDPNAASPGALQTQANDLIQGFINPVFWPRWGSTENTLYRSELIARLQALSGVLSVTLVSPAADVLLGAPNATLLLTTLSVGLLSSGQV